MSQYLRQSFGLNSTFSAAAAVLFYYLSLYGLNPVITSGFRSPENQAEKRARWDAGNRAGLKVRPARPENSLHCRVTSVLKSPDSKAVDISTSDSVLAGRIARALGVGWGGDFQEADPVHFFLAGAAGL